VNYLIMISVAGKPKAIEKLIEKLDAIVMNTTMEDGIDGLTTEVVKGVGAEAARERARDVKRLTHSGKTRMKGGKS
jgi:hypothetical protein